jgi:hypothetical protein
LVLNLEPEHTVNDARRALDDHPFLHGLCVEISTLDVDMVGLLRERNKAVAVYTCDTEAEIEHALTLEVDILISDVPQKALRMRDECSSVVAASMARGRHTTLRCADSRSRWSSRATGRARPRLHPAN